MNNIWHNSNEEQPDGKRRTVCYCLNTNGGEVGIHTIVNPNYRWAYLEDLDSEYVECGNCINDKGCIVCEHGEQKQTLEGMINMSYNLERLKEIAKPRSKEAIDKFNKRYLRRHNKMEKDTQATCSAELMDQISFINGTND